MVKRGLGLDDEGSSQGEPQSKSPQESRRLSIQRCNHSLVHACQCRNANCSLPSCQKMRRIVQHTKGCKRKTNGGCPVCKRLIAVCCHHAKHCQENKCIVPFCLNIKHKLRQQQIQHRLQQVQLMRRRMATMNTRNVPQQSLPSPTSAPPGTRTQQPCTLQTPQPTAQPPPAAVEAARQIELEAQQQQHLYQVNINNSMSPGHTGMVTPVSQMAPVGLNVPRHSQDYDLCINCYNTKSHTHKMGKRGLGLDDEGGSQGEPQSKSPKESWHLCVQRFIQSLVHACQCRNANCSLPSCHKIKRIVQHTKGCKRKTNGGCPVCKQLIAVCCHHVKHCQENKCIVPFCLNIKHKPRQQQIQHRLQQAQLMRRRMATMNTRNVPQQSLPSPTSAPPGTPTQLPSTPQTPQPTAQPQPRL